MPVDRHVLTGCSLFPSFQGSEINAAWLANWVAPDLYWIFTYIMFGSSWILRGQQKMKGYKTQNESYSEAY